MRRGVDERVVGNTYPLQATYLREFAGRQASQVPGRATCLPLRHPSTLVAVVRNNSAIAQGCNRSPRNDIDGSS